ncbi:MAG: EF-hand domain-containing protein [Pseudomonadota bacterium]
MCKQQKALVAPLSLAIAGLFVTAETASADCFDSVDTDSSGAVSYTEFIAAADGACDALVLDQIFDDADVNADGELNCEEFAKAAMDVDGCQP